MRGKQVIARAALVCGAAGIVCVLWSAVDDTAAHAADRSSDLLPGVAVELPDGLGEDLGHTAEQIPQRATPTRDAATRAAKTVKRTQDQVEQVVTSVVDAVQPPATAPVLPVPVVRPHDGPATPPPAENPTPATPQAVPAVALLAGTAPSTVTIDPTQAHTIGPAAAYALLCGDVLGPRPSRPDHTADPNGTPCTPDGRDTTGLATVKPPTKTGVDQLAAITSSGPAAPALRLLGELLPRSDLPTGRTTHPEPGPA